MALLVVHQNVRCSFVKLLSANSKFRLKIFQSFIIQIATFGDFCSLQCEIAVLNESGLEFRLLKGFGLPCFV